MRIKIDDIVMNMDAYRDKYYDVRDCVIVDLDNMDEGKQYIKLPEVKEADIIRDYIENQDYKFLRDISQISNDMEIISSFHRRINDLGWYEDWTNYRQDYLRNMAEKWYKEMWKQSGM